MYEENYSLCFIFINTLSTSGTIRAFDCASSRDPINILTFIIWNHVGSGGHLNLSLPRIGCDYLFLRKVIQRQKRLYQGCFLF